MAMAYEDELAKRRSSERRKAYQQAYREKNREYFREYSRQYLKTYRRKGGEGYWGHQKADTHSKRCRAIASGIVGSIRQRCRKHGRQCEITQEWVEERLISGRCELTGLPFVLERRSPYMPSIDRIDSAGPYVPSNCRLVILLVNYAKNAWPEAEFLPALLAAADGVRRMGQKSA